MGFAGCRENKTEYDKQLNSMDMKKKYVGKIALLWITGAFLFASCEKNELMDYEGVDAIYFDVQYGASHGNESLWARQNYTYVSFGTLEDTVVDLKLKIGIAGSVRDYDRPFRVEIVRDSSNAIAEEEYADFSENQVIKAGENKTYVTLRVFKTARLIKDTARIQFRIDPGEHFSLPFIEVGKIPGRWNDEGTQFKTSGDPAVHDVFFNNLLQRPAGWGVNEYSAYFGTFSPTKYQYLMDVTGYTKAHFEQLSAMTQGGRGTKIRMMAYTDLIAKFNKGYARLQKGDADGWKEWVLDEKGTMMWVPGVTWWSEKTLPEELVKQYYKPQDNQ